MRCRLHAGIRHAHQCCAHAPSSSCFFVFWLTSGDDVRVFRATKFSLTDVVARNSPYGCRHRRYPAPIRGMSLGMRDDPRSAAPRPPPLCLMFPPNGRTPCAAPPRPKTSSDDGMQLGLREPGAGPRGSGPARRSGRLQDQAAAGARCGRPDHPAARLRGGHAVMQLPTPTSSSPVGRRRSSSRRGRSDISIGGIRKLLHALADCLEQILVEHFSIPFG